jgi:transposase
VERIDAQRREVKRRIMAAVTAAHSSITDVYGVGPIVAATVLGQVRDICRFPNPDRFASYNGTAPIKVASADWVLYRLSRRGNRQLNHLLTELKRRPLVSSRRAVTFTATVQRRDWNSGRAAGSRITGRVAAWVAGGDR